MPWEFNEKVIELRKAGVPFVTAIVTRHEKPSSGKTGDKAIILADKTIFGWIGGGCAQPIVLNEAKKSLLDGKPRLVRVSKQKSSDLPPGIIEIFMNCHSGGSIDIYIEPVLPYQHLLILGKSLIAQNLCTLGKAMNYHVTVIAKDANDERFSSADVVYDSHDVEGLEINPNSYVVIATQGDYDEEALHSVTKYNFPYVSFISSRKKSKVLFQELLSQGITKENLAKIKNPAGLDLGAKLPEEVALTILAEIIQIRNEINDESEHERSKGSNPDVDEENIIPAS